MIVEVQGKGLWTRVQIPSTPLDHEVTSPLQGCYYNVFKNVFVVIADFDVIEDNITDKDAEKVITFADIRQWVNDV